jgi:hypothetical protein
MIQCEVGQLVAVKRYSAPLLLLLLHQPAWCVVRGIIPTKQLLPWLGTCKPWYVPNPRITSTVPTAAAAALTTSYLCSYWLETRSLAAQQPAVRGCATALGHLTLFKSNPVVGSNQVKHSRLDRALQPLLLLLLQLLVFTCLCVWNPEK